MTTKSVVAVDKNLPMGLKANIAAVLGLSLGKAHPELIGTSVASQDSEVFAGIINTPLPILETDAVDLAELYWKSVNNRLTVFCFTDCALMTKNYNDYTARCAETLSQDMIFHGVLIHGPKKIVNRFSGSYPLLK